MTGLREEASFFLEPPSGIDIAHYFWDEIIRGSRETYRRGHYHGCNGITLYRGGSDYCYLWVEAVVDLDMWGAYLLDVRTAVDVSPGEFGETRDFLFLIAGAGGRFDVEWQNKPIRFDDDTEAHRDRFHAGMHWFTARIEKALEDEDERVTS